MPGNPPGKYLPIPAITNSDSDEDIYHSYLGLAALAVMEEPGIKSLDPVLCISMQQKEIIDEFRRRATVPTRSYWKHGYRFSIREDDPEFDKIMASNEEPPIL